MSYDTKSSSRAATGGPAGASSTYAASRALPQSDSARRPISYGAKSGGGFSAGSRPAARGSRNGKQAWKKGPRADAQKTPDPILFQTYFKSVGPRTYATQLKRAGNGNHYLVFTEGKRDAVTDEVRKTSVYVFSEDFVSYFKMLKEMAEYVKAHPVPKEVAEKRTKFWQKQKSTTPGARTANPIAGTTAPASATRVRKP